MSHVVKAAALAAAQSANLRAGAPVMSLTVDVTVSGCSTNHSHAVTAACFGSSSQVSFRPMASPIAASCSAWVSTSGPLRSYLAPA
jgi:hypothetical protein